MIKILELFGGIGACSKALERLGIDYEISDYVEIDKYAVKSFNAIHNTNFEPQDICEWNKDIEVDLIMHGSPCQDFSLAGKQAGGDKDSGTRSSLMYETIRIVEKLKPKYVIWENVKNLLSKKHRHNFDAYLETMEQLGYTNYYQVLNAKDYGIPQNRERVFTISIRKDINKVFTFPPKQELKLKLKDMLEDNVDEKYYLSDKMIKYISATGTANFRNPDSKINLDIARPLTTDQNKRAGTTNYLSEDLPSNYNLNEVVRKYGIFDTEKSTHQAGSVYDENGLSPTLDTMQGGYRQPCIEIKETIKQGYKTAYEGDGANTSSMTEYQRENVQEQTIQTITTSDGSDRGVVVDKLPGAYGRDFGSKGKIQNKEYCDTLTASMGTGGGNVPIIKDYGLYGNKQAGSVYNKNGLCPTITTEASQNWNILLNDNPKIRKLTPKECWRLMGFDDEDFEKAEKVNSNTQLYKQAGNSIVVNVLEAIFNNLLIDYKQDVKK